MIVKVEVDVVPRDGETRESVEDRVDEVLAFGHVSDALAEGGVEFTSLVVVGSPETQQPA